jgi:O-antigen/teichoic acid export membrane protein
VAKLSSQAASFILRLVALMIMARLLSPAEFGLVAMVTVITGFYTLFTSAGLSSATVQRVTVTDEQISTLFWINMLVGAALCALCLASAPVLVAFYDEPRLLWITVAMALGFLVNAAGVQHFAILQRELRYVTLSAMEVVSQVLSLATGIMLAVAGFGYWALVASALVAPAVTTVLAWAFARWIPGRPRRRTEIRSMLRFGGAITIQSVLSYVADTVDKILVARVSGAAAFGVYGRAYQLVSMPRANLNAAVGWVAFSSLSRIQDDTRRYRSYFLKGYQVVVSIVVPIVVFEAVFADDLVRVVLGSQWSDAALILQLLAPAVIALTLIEGPTYWLLHSLGLAARSLQATVVFTSVIVTACIVGVRYGATGVAAACSIASVVWLIPHLKWCVRGTPIQFNDLLQATWPPLLGSVVASLASFFLVHDIARPLVGLMLGGVLMCGAYFVIVWFVPRQREFYRGLGKNLRLISRAG